MSCPAARLERRLGRREPAVELDAPGHARQDHVDQAAPRRDRQVLRQVADAHALRDRDAAVVDLLVARDDLEQRRLAGAVRADQADAVAVAEAQARVAEDHPIPEEQRHAIEDNQAHRRRFLARYGPSNSALSNEHDVAPEVVAVMSAPTSKDDGPGITSAPPCRPSIDGNDVT